jgi:O-antigen ligase/Flp pilus assembly protein TadD
MARNKRKGPDRPGQAAAGSAAVPAPQVAVRSDTAAGGPPLPAEVVRDDWTVPIFAMMMLLAPALGVPHEEMLQDTLKSAIVSFCALAAALLFFWRQRSRGEPLRWHALVWLPLMLLAHALGSMAWSHTYLAGAEAVRWFIFALLLWLGANTLTRERLPLLAWGIHGGAVLAALWAALQFWIDFALFPQGPNPASTFVNRNFFAEFAACTLPLSLLLLATQRRPALIALTAGSTGLVIVAILMTGTRSALMSMWLLLFLVAPLIAWIYRGSFAFSGWSRGARALAVGGLLATVAVLGVVPTGNPKIVAEERGTTPIERGFKRTAAIRTDDASLSIRMVMWRATARMIIANPLSGVGAGAWENEAPLYQEAGAQLETDYYVHNEYLQLLAEYGLVGWAFVLLLLGYLGDAAWRTWRDRRPQGQAEAPERAVVLASLLALLVVSNAGFPWRMASTGALFALCLGFLAASDARLGRARRWSAAPLGWNPGWSRVALAASAAALVLAVYITQVAAESESKIVRAAKIALTVTASGNPNNPRWNDKKAEMLKLTREGVALNPHYRKITPMIADELARWGDWTNALWVWQSVLGSRPNVVAIMTNVARGYAATNRDGQALQYLEAARKLQPDAPSVLSLEVILLSRTGRADQALEVARRALDKGLDDYDLANSAFLLASARGDYVLADRAMRRRIQMAPESEVNGLMALGDMYATRARDAAKAEAVFRSAVERAPEARRAALLRDIPPDYAARMGLAGTGPAQTSASSK